MEFSKRLIQTFDKRLNSTFSKRLDIGLVYVPLPNVYVTFFFIFTARPHCLQCTALWRRGVAVERRTRDREVVGSSLDRALRRKNSGQVSHTYG